jgi:hypothetical protein
MDRLGRTLVDIHQTILRFAENNVDVIVLDFKGREIDTRTAEGKELIRMMAVYIEFQHRFRSNRMREGIAYRKANGLVYCSQVPLGNRLARDKYGQKMWVRDYRQCAILRQIYILRHDRGMSYNDIAKRFHHRGIVDQNGQPWAWLSGSFAKPRYKTSKLAKAYRHVAQVLEETGQYPQPGPPLGSTDARPRAKKASRRDRPRQSNGAREVSKALDCILRILWASRPLYLPKSLSTR